MGCTAKLSPLEHLPMFCATSGAWGRSCAGASGPRSGWRFQTPAGLARHVLPFVRPDSLDRRVQTHSENFEEAGGPVHGDPVVLVAFVA